MLDTAVPKPPMRSKKSPTPIARTAAKRVNVKRSKAEFVRCFGSKERVEWIKRQSCVVCGRSPCENHHIESGGKGRKADANKIVPLCALSRRMLHHVGRKTYEEFYEIDLDQIAIETEKQWQAFVGSGESKESR